MRLLLTGMRLLDKLAVVMGGGCNHRIGLYDMVLVKDNHVEAAGGIVPAINAVDTYLQQQVRPILFLPALCP